MPTAWACAVAGDKQDVEPRKRPWLGPGEAEAAFMKRSGMKADAAEPAPRRGFWNGGTPPGGGALVCLYPILRVDFTLPKCVDLGLPISDTCGLPPFGR